jgi:hypothetical protein
MTTEEAIRRIEEATKAREEAIRLAHRRFRDETILVAELMNQEREWERRSNGATWYGTRLPDAIRSASGVIIATLAGWLSGSGGGSVTRPTSPSG